MKKLLPDASCMINLCFCTFINWTEVVADATSIVHGEQKSLMDSYRCNIAQVSGSKFILIYQYPGHGTKLIHVANMIPRTLEGKVGIFHSEIRIWDFKCTEHRLWFANGVTAFDFLVSMFALRNDHNAAFTLEHDLLRSPRLTNRS